MASSLTTRNGDSGNRTGKTSASGWQSCPFLGTITQPAEFSSVTGSPQLPPHQDVRKHYPWMEQAHGIEQGWDLIQLQSTSLLFLSQSLGAALPCPSCLRCLCQFKCTIILTLGENAAQGGSTLPVPCTQWVPAQRIQGHSPTSRS